MKTSEDRGGGVGEVGGGKGSKSIKNANNVKGANGVKGVRGANNPNSVKKVDLSKGTKGLRGTKGVIGNRGQQALENVGIDGQEVDVSNNPKCVLVLIDPITKISVSDLAYDAISKKLTIITDIREVNAAFRGYRLITFEPSFGLIVTRDIIDFLEATFDVHTIAVYQNEDSKGLLGNNVQLVRVNYNSIDWNLIYGIIHSDRAMLEPYQRMADKVGRIDAFKAVRARVPKDVGEYLDKFRSSYIILAEHNRELSEENTKLRETIDAQESIGKRSIDGIKELKSLLDATNDRLRAYEVILSENYDVTFHGFYPDKPNVLYIKSISHVSGIDIFLSVLFTVLTTQYKMSCKVIKLVDESNSRLVRYVPNMYVPVSSEYDTSIVLNSEFIMKTGPFNVLFDLLMLNKSGLDFLIVHDMRCAMKDALDPSLITLKINEVSTDYAVLEEYSNVLSDLGKQVAFPWSYRECKGYLGTGISKLVNHPTIIKVINGLL